MLLLGFPDGLVVKTPLANAGDTGSIHDPGRSQMPRSKPACVPQLLSLCSGPGSHRYCVHTPQILESAPRNKRGHCSRKPAHCNQRVAPIFTTRKKPEHSTEDPAQPKKVNEKKFLMLYFSPQKVVKSCWSGLLLQAVETSYASRFKQKEIH